MSRRTSSKSTCCKAAWLYETVAGMRVYREARGCRRYRVKCSVCQRVSEVSS
jgi:hypothetical protein